MMYVYDIYVYDIYDVCIYQGVDKFIVKSKILSINCSIFATVSKGIITDHTAPRDYSPRAMAEHQLRQIRQNKRKS